MSKIIVGLISIFLILFFLIPPGQAKGNLVCKVSQKMPEKCTPHLVLEYADMTISDTDQFMLQGRYGACYHSEDVTIMGRVKRFSYYDGVDLELLATEILPSSTNIQNFPRTIGTITLKKASMSGYFFDIWSSIRSRGIYQQDPFSSVIRCEITQ